MRCERCHGKGGFVGDYGEPLICGECMGSGIVSCCDAAGATSFAATNEAKPMPQYELVVMRLANMRRMHPAQDNSRVCSKCGERVGIYPSGQAVLKQRPDAKILCEVCVDFSMHDLSVVAPGALAERAESYEIDKKGPLQ